MSLWHAMVRQPAAVPVKRQQPFMPTGPAAAEKDVGKELVLSCVRYRAQTKMVVYSAAMKKCNNAYVLALRAEVITLKKGNAGDSVRSRGAVLSLFVRKARHR